MIEAFALQIALVLEKEHFIQAVSHAEMLSQSEKLHRTLLDSVSHELKTPIAIITAALEGMHGQSSPYLGEISTATQRLQRVVDSLLQMTQLESDVLKPSLDWCDVRDVISAAQHAVGAPLDTHAVKLRLADDFPLLKLDHALLTQAVANVLHNAAIYTPAGSAIDISTTMRDQQLRLVIRDHGPGLPEGAERRVFEKFYRVQGSPAGGTGLGLAIARGFVQAQGGEITARNHPDGGAEFVIEINRVSSFVPPVK